MTMYKIRVECDSVSPRGHRLTSLVWTYPREVLAEARTHRTISATSEALFSDKTLTAHLSMNSASSRAIPVQKMLAAVETDPWVPFFWGKAQKGMQADECLAGAGRAEADAIWLDAMRYCASAARRLLELGVHKQHANRLVEPWAWVTQVVTGTDDAWANFFSLRTHHAAAPPIRHLARLAYLAYARSRPTLLQPGEWHLPFVRKADIEALCREVRDPGAYSALLVRLSVARCGWVSTLKHEKEASLKEAEEFHDRMVGAFPLHASPGEHQATPVTEREEHENPEWRSNLHGWLQYRKTMPQEFIREFHPDRDTLASWGLEEAFAQAHEPRES
jgi:hypothetical protein